VENQKNVYEMVGSGKRRELPWAQFEKTKE